MKKKTSFVTNSSTTSYLMMGVNVTDQIRTNHKLLKAIYEKYSIDYPNTGYEQFVATVDIEYNMEYCNKEILAGLSYINTPDSDIIMGLQLYEISDEEKWIEFKKRVCDKLTAIGFKINIKDVCIQNESWFAG